MTHGKRTDSVSPQNNFFLLLVFLRLAAVLLLILLFVLGSYYLTRLSFPLAADGTERAAANRLAAISGARRSALRYVNIHFTRTQTTRCSSESRRVQNKQSGSQVSREDRVCVCVCVCVCVSVCVVKSNTNDLYIWVQSF